MPRPFLLIISSLAISLLLSGCGSDAEKEVEKSPKVVPGIELSESTPAESDIQATEAVSKQLEAFTGGHTRLVWVKYTGGKGDVFANGRILHLYGIDTRDGKGVRQIGDERGNYTRPLITPDGQSIVFTRKNTEILEDKTKRFTPVICIADFETGEVTELTDGNAVDVWKDRDTGIVWIYATDLLPTGHSSMLGSKLVRFKLLDPDDREMIYDQSEISTDNIQVSRDGKRLSCQFPWPKSGVLDTSNGDYWENQQGCWPSLAPDNSYVGWVFDGAHKNLHFFTDRTERTWKVPVNTGPGMDGHEVYHPRWSNHVRFFSVTGPYIGESIARGTGNVNIYLGKFSERLESVEDWIQITSDEKDDYYPDLWVASGEKAGQADTLLTETQVIKSPSEIKWWPRDGAENLLYLWETRKTPNKVAQGRICSVEASELARFGPAFEMLPEGGFFEADDASSKVLSDHLSGKKSLTIEITATANELNQNGIVMANEHFQIQQRDGKWVFITTSDENPVSLSMGRVLVGKPTHLTARYTKSWRVYRNGQAIEEPAPPIDTVFPQENLIFGSGWNGALEGVAIYPRSLKGEEILANYDYFAKTIAARPAISQIRVKAKLLEMTPHKPVEALDTYQRALLGYLYEVENVIEGEFDKSRILVHHWTIMDRKLLSGFPRRPNQSYELILEKMDDHPQLTSERQWNDIFDPDATEPHTPYYDVEPPKP